MSGGFDAIIDVGFDALGDVASFFPSDLGSLVTDFGTEFMSSFPALDAFQIPAFDVASLGGFGEIGSLAGSASWFDTFSSGSILSSIPGVSDFNISSLTSSLPSLSSIKDISSTITSGVSGITGTLQTVTTAINKVAPIVNTASSALGIQNPLTQVTRSISQVSGIAGAATGIAGTASGAITSLGNLSTNSLVSSGAAALGINPGTASSLTAKATSLFTTDPTSANAIDRATGLSINTPREVDSFGLGILTAQEDRQLIRNATLINSLADPELPSVSTYPEAIASQQELALVKEEYQNALIDNEKAIANSNKNIEELQANLRDPDLTRTQQELLETQIDANYEVLSRATDNVFTTQQLLNEVNDQLASDQQIITQTNASVVSDPTDVSSEEDPFEAARQRAIAEEDNSPTEQAVIDAGQDAKLSQEEEGQLREFQAQQRVLLSAEDVPTGANSRLPSITSNTIVGASNITALVTQAKAQQTVRDLRQNKAQSSDWRVRLRLAPSANYLYNDPVDPGILSPLSAKTGTDGVIFPYTPAIETAYKANYDTYDLTHSNFRGYFYRGSYVDAVNMRCTFTAQDTSEANYLLAVIHFFRSVTKMFYGQDAQRGSPPPLVFLSGLGEYQFNEHACVVSQFNYTLPPDVDYIRAYSTLDMSTNLLANRTRTSISGNPLSYGINRLLNSGLVSGAVPSKKAPDNLEIKEPTYVPTKMEIAITLLPMQSRQQVSSQFSLKGFANGNLLKGGFW